MSCIVSTLELHLPIILPHSIQEHFYEEALRDSGGWMVRVHVGSSTVSLQAGGLCTRSFSPQADSRDTSWKGRVEALGT